MTTTAVAAAGASLVPLASASAGVRVEADPPFDDSWTRRVSAAKFKALFDSANIEDGIALKHVAFYLEGFKEQLGATGNDIVPVLVMRHAGTWMALNDAMWEKYSLGDRAKTKDFRTGASALRNPFIHVNAGEARVPFPADGALDVLSSKGVVLLTCNKALGAFAGMVAQATSQEGDAVHKEFRANLAPNVIAQPSGIYAVHRAQSVGCTFIKSS